VTDATYILYFTFQLLRFVTAMVSLSRFSDEKQIFLIEYSLVRATFVLIVVIVNIVLKHTVVESSGNVTSRQGTGQRL
jgi:c-di-GMP-related signal transduction protein